MAEKKMKNTETHKEVVQDLGREAPAEVEVEAGISFLGTIENKSTLSGKRLAYGFMETKQPQKPINLATGEEEKVHIITKRVVWTSDVTDEQKLGALESLITPISKRVQALETYIKQSSYQESKSTVMSKGEYMTPELRSTLVMLMQSKAAFESTSASDCYDRFMKGFATKHPFAIKLLTETRALLAAKEEDVPEDF